MDCSIIFQRIISCAIGHLPTQNPACSHLNFVSMQSLIHSMTTLPRSFLGIESKEIPLKLSHVVKSPFLGTLTTFIAFYQSSGTSSHSHIYSQTTYTSILQQLRLLGRLLAITEDCWRLSREIQQIKVQIKVQT